ncbi:hypothetical protein ABIB25_000422 [Nakamurella sp. UYEF19]|uniref:DUF2550 domain-containing protein n=1 Tax=Nakamurella sp. UYEF19 TaxID=1756392 RepID=UPI00339AD90F
MSAEIVGLALLLVLLLSIVAIAVRRSLLTRSGGVDICWRSSLGPEGRGWSFGQARYREGELILYRSFSPLPLASRVMLRDRLMLGERRGLAGTEPDLLPVGSVVIRCTDGSAPVELALTEEAVTGLRSWLESVPPATGSISGRRRGGLTEV